MFYMVFHILVPLIIYQQVQIIQRKILGALRSRTWDGISLEPLNDHMEGHSLDIQLDYDDSKY